MALIHTIPPSALAWETFQLEPDDVVSGDTAAEIARAYVSADGLVEAGIWRAGVGAFRHDPPEDGTLYLIEGRIAVAPDDGEPVEAAAGDFLRLPAKLPFIFDVREPSLVIYTLDHH